MVSAVTIVGGNLTALTVDPTETSFDLTELNSQNYICVVDKFGNVKASNILYDSVSALGVFTLSSFALDGSTFTTGDYVIVGQNMTNLPEWVDVCEGYLLKHMVYEAKYGDSSSWTPQAQADMTAYFQKLSGSFATIRDDIDAVPITNLDYVGW